MLNGFIGEAAERRGKNMYEALNVLNEITVNTVTTAQGGGQLSTGSLSDWIVKNLVPLLLLTVALLLLWLGGGRGDNSGVMKRVGGVFVALAIIGIAINPGSAPKIGAWLASLFGG
jgi:hypothetical protein